MVANKKWQKRVRVLSPPPPYTVQKPQACSISLSFTASPLQRKSPALQDGAWLECRRQRRAGTLNPRPPCTVEQPQACSTSRKGIMAAPLQKNTCRLGRIILGRDEHAPSLISLLIRTLEQAKPSVLDQTELHVYVTRCVLTVQ